ncbi:hypothetical protein Pen01_36430 [Phytomonospora endophytica]|nr:hypothetical protein Pen01_36430 [Phytomonospora endophytica]
MEERIGSRFDTIEVGQLRDDERVLSRLPPYVELLLKSDMDRAGTWNLIAPFTDENVDPRQLAGEWSRAVPSAVSELSAQGCLVVAELLRAYGQPIGAIESIERALGLGVSSRPYWHFRCAQIVWQVEGEDSNRAAEYLNSALEIDPMYPLVNAALRCHQGAYADASQYLVTWNAATAWEQDAAAGVAASIAWRQGLQDEAILAIERIATSTSHAGLLLQLAQLLRYRSVRGNGDSRWKDAFRALDLALQARNSRRVWRGDSAEAVAAAAQAAIIVDDMPQVWSITRPEPEGTATKAEAGDPRVLPMAAAAAAQTGRLSQAREIADATDDGLAKLLIEAEIASSQSTVGNNNDAIAKWEEVLAASVSDEDKVQALRALALEGSTNQAAIEALKQRQSAAVEEIRLIEQVMTVRGSNADELLRQLESETQLASVRRAELLRADDKPLEAAEVLIDATERWENPRLLSMAIDSYMEAGEWERAAEAAQLVLADSGRLWAGRATVLRRLMVIQEVLKDWPKLAAVCRGLLEIDEQDDDARWSLAYAEFRNGEDRRAWETLRRLGSLRASTKHRAIFLLELARRFSDSEEMARTGLSQLQAFPDDEDIHAAVIHAISMRRDNADLPADVSREVSAAWSTFLELYPESTHFTAYTLPEDDHPLAEIETILQEQAATYERVLKMISDQLAPIGLLDRVVGKPYAAIFPYRPLGYHRIATVAQQDIDIELGHAREMRTRGCILDASALFTLALIPDVASTLIALIGRPAATAAAISDVLAADDYFSLPVAGTLGFDSKHGKIFAAGIEDDVRRRQHKQVRAMLDMVRSLRRIMHPAMIHLDSISSNGEPPWLLNLDAAKHANAALWCDDLGLRRLAHGLGVRTFGTVSLISVALERNIIDEENFSRIILALLREYVVDLPFDEQSLLSLAAGDEWEPRAAAVVLSRAAAWVKPESSVLVLRRALRNAPPVSLAAWLHSAFVGIKGAFGEADLRENLVGVIAAIMREAWAGPGHLGAAEVALNELVSDMAGEIVRAVLNDLWKYVSNRHSSEEAAMIFLYLAGQLDDTNRHYAMAVVLGTG